MAIGNVRRSTAYDKNQKYTHLKPGTSATRKQTLVNQPADSKWEWD